MEQYKQGPSDIYRDMFEPGWREAESEIARKLAESVPERNMKMEDQNWNIWAIPDTRAVFPVEMLEKVVMTPAQTAIAKTGHCPKCMEKFDQTTEGGGVRLSKCCRCGKIFSV